MKDKTKKKREENQTQNREDCGTKVEEEGEEKPTMIQEVEV